ncbi:DNA-binding response regulator [Treponema ruminis]|uniref:DNA-binding NarL/FixJ family response regulator n=1 Tax=Treponema ruminis TaxID=744515 RepID=A0A7W8GB69_9SPIR|nr:response regulator transcription factor [Treponema ruminis]MBB5227227.1 DNA-binding NarL/FixJ family response regulator [Treponema ruminis]QSI01544.1 DNA-binding response regulator [Treponema ruminis]
MKHSFFVIEDHSLTNLGIRELLQNNTDLSCEGFAMSEEEAFEKLTELDMKGSLPKVLVLDLFLGEDSGIDVLREVKKHFPSIGVVVYSMYSNPGIVSLVLENGGNGFVSKSSPESELVDAIKEVSAGGSHIQSSLVEPLHTFKNLFQSLTKGEQFVLNKVIERFELNRIAEEMKVPVARVEIFLSRICAKTGCHNHEELIAQFG